MTILEKEWLSRTLDIKNFSPHPNLRHTKQITI